MTSEEKHSEYDSDESEWILSEDSEENEEIEENNPEEVEETYSEENELPEENEETEEDDDTSLIDGGADLSQETIEALREIDKSLDKTEEESGPYAGSSDKKSGQNGPVAADNFVLESLAGADLDNFETKFYSKKAKEAEAVTNKFISGKNLQSNKFISNVSDEREKLDVAALKESWNKDYVKGLDLADQNTADVVKVSKNVKTKFTEDLDKSISKLKTFLLNDIAPVEWSIDNAFDEVNQTLERIIDGDVTAENRAVMNMIADSIKIKVFSFVADQLKLPKKQQDLILNKYFVIQPSKNHTHKIARDSNE